MADETVRVEITGDASGAFEAFSGVGDALDDIKGKLNTAFEITGLAAAYEAVKSLGEAIDAAALSAVHLKNSAEILGINTTELQGLRAAADAAGVGAQTLDRSLEMLALRMQQARDGNVQMQEKLAAVGITLANLRDPTFTAASAAAVLASSHATSAEKMDVLGRRGLELLPVFDKLKGGEQAAMQAAKDLGALTDDQIEILRAYHEQVAEAGTRWTNFKDSILAGVAPALGDLLGRLEDVFGILNTGTSTTEHFGSVMRAIESEVLKWASAFRQLYLDTKILFDELGTSIGNIAAATAAAATGHFSRAKEIWKEGTADLLAIEQKYAADTLENEKTLQQALIGVENSQLTGVTVTARKRPTEDNAVTVPFDKMSRESAKYAEMEIREANQILDAMKKTAELTLDADEESKAGQIEAAHKALEEELRSGQISASEFLRQENALIDQRIALQRAYYAEKQKLAVGDEVELAKIQVQINKAEAQALKDRQTADNQARQAELAQWKQLGQTMEASFISNIKGMIEGTKSFGDAVRSIFSSLIDGIIQMFLKMAVQWAENMITQEILGKTTAVSQISANAGMAASAAMASVAAIPFVGWAMAPGVGAATFAEAEAYTASVAAAGGMDIPQGINPVTQLHASEMVLPATIADTVRQAAQSTGGRTRAPSVNLKGQQFGNFYLTTLDNLREAMNHIVRTRGGPMGAF